MGLKVEAVREVADTRRTETALALGGAQVSVGHAPGWAADVTIEQDGSTLQLGVSRLVGEVGWTVDSLSVDGVPGWANGEGARYLRTKVLTDVTAVAALDELVGEKFDEVAAAEPVTELTSKWCQCEPQCEFHSYPADGACSCGMVKHHVHGVCGGVQQIG